MSHSNADFIHLSMTGGAALDLRPSEVVAYWQDEQVASKTAMLLKNGARIRVDEDIQTVRERVAGVLLTGTGN